MMNRIFALLVTVSIAFALLSGRTDQLSLGVLQAADSSVKLILNLAGALMLWSGLMRVAERSGLTASVARVLRRPLNYLFPSLSNNQTAMATVSLAVTANLLGIGNAATPLGIRAMEEMKKASRRPNQATDAMCTFAVLTTSSITLLPISVLALRTAHGSADPTSIVGPTIAATAVSTAVALIADRVFRYKAKISSKGGSV